MKFILIIILSFFLISCTVRLDSELIIEKIELNTSPSSGSTKYTVYLKTIMKDDAVYFYTNKKYEVGDILNIKELYTKKIENEGIRKWILLRTFQKDL